MGHSLITEYGRTLAELSGDDFEDEVSARLESVIVDFQSVPASPHGDAGLDAFSHAGEMGYCCDGRCTTPSKAIRDGERHRKKVPRRSAESVRSGVRQEEVNGGGDC